LKEADRRFPRFSDEKKGFLRRRKDSLSNLPPKKRFPGKVLTKGGGVGLTKEVKRKFLGTLCC